MLERVVNYDERAACKQNEINRKMSKDATKKKTRHSVTRLKEHNRPVRTEEVRETTNNEKPGDIRKASWIPA